MPNYVTLDVETTIINEGNPFVQANRLCLVGLLDSDGYHEYYIEYDERPYGEALAEIRRRVEAATVLIGFNIKFDLHWIRRYVPDIKFPRIYDCQLAEFILRDQSESYPSLGDVAVRRGLGAKLDVVATQYWAHGIDTTQVPSDILSEYCQHDVELTRKIFDEQRRELFGRKRVLFAEQCADLLVLQEMEWNGLRYDTTRAAEKGEITRHQLEQLDVELRSIEPHPCINWGSFDHLSCVLYGGSIPEAFREQTERVLKDGTIKYGERWAVRAIDFPRLVEPLKGSESVDTGKYSDADLSRINSERASLGKTGLVRHWSVSEPILRRLRPSGKAKRIIGLVLKRAELKKLDTTYYSGLVEKLVEFGWPKDHIHGLLNQCTAVTGRLAASKPNVQNMAGDIKELFYSRYAD